MKKNNKGNDYNDCSSSLEPLGDQDGQGQFTDDSAGSSTIQSWWNWLFS